MQYEYTHYSSVLTAHIIYDIALLFQAQPNYWARKRGLRMGSDIVATIRRHAEERGYARIENGICSYCGIAGNYHDANCCDECGKVLVSPENLAKGILNS